MKLHFFTPAYALGSSDVSCNYHSKAYRYGVLFMTYEGNPKRIGRTHSAITVDPPPTTFSFLPLSFLYLVPLLGLCGLDACSFYGVTCKLFVMLSFFENNNIKGTTKTNSAHNGHPRPPPVSSFPESWSRNRCPTPRLDFATFTPDQFFVKELTDRILFRFEIEISTRSFFPQNIFIKAERTFTSR